MVETKNIPDPEKLYEDPPKKGFLIVFYGAPLSGIF